MGANAPMRFIVTTHEGNPLEELLTLPTPIESTPPIDDLDLVYDLPERVITPFEKRPSRPIEILPQGARRELVGVEMGVVPESRSYQRSYTVFNAERTAKSGTNITSLPSLMAAMYYMQYNLATMEEFDFRRERLESLYNELIEGITEFLTDYVLISAFGEARHGIGLFADCERCNAIFVDTGLSTRAVQSRTHDRANGASSLWFYYANGRDRSAAFAWLKHIFNSHQWGGGTHSPGVGGTNWGYISMVGEALNIAYTANNHNEMVRIIDIIAYAAHAGSQFLQSRFQWSEPYFSWSLMNVLTKKQIASPCCWSQLRDIIPSRYQVVPIPKVECKFAPKLRWVQGVNADAFTDCSIPTSKHETPSEEIRHRANNVLREEDRCKVCDGQMLSGSCQNRCSWCDDPNNMYPHIPNLLHDQILALHYPYDMSGHVHRCVRCNYHFPDPDDPKKSCPNVCSICKTCFQPGSIHRFHSKCHSCLEAISDHVIAGHRYCRKCGGKNVCPVTAKCVVCIGSATNPDPPTLVQIERAFHYKLIERVVYDELRSRFDPMEVKKFDSGSSKRRYRRELKPTPTRASSRLRERVEQKHDNYFDDGATPNPFKGVKKNGLKPASWIFDELFGTTKGKLDAILVEANNLFPTSIPTTSTTSGDFYVNPNGQLTNIPADFTNQYLDSPNLVEHLDSEDV